MKLYIIGANPAVPTIIEHLKDLYDIKVDVNEYTKNLDIEKLSVSDLTFKTNFADAILLANLQQINQKITLIDGAKTLNDSVFEIYKHSLWFTLNTNDAFNYYVDKFDLNHFELSNTTPFYITSKIALSEILLQKMIQNSSKLLHQQKTLVLGYNDHAKLLCDTLSSNRMVVVVSDRMLQELVEAKKDGYGVVLKEEINTSPIRFDNVIIEDYIFIDLLKRNDNAHYYVIDYKEDLKQNGQYEYILPYQLICNQYAKLMGQNIASSLKKEIREYYKGA